MTTLTEHYVVLFGGQGSPSIFSSNVAATADVDVRSATVGSILLSRCHAAFLQEIASLDTHSQELVAIDIALFSHPRDLLRPAAQFHTHAVIQATTVYLCQLLHYLAEIQRVDGSLEEWFDRLRETAGFCSGLLPATVVARSCSLDDFVISGIEGFRIAFWIACRSLLWSLNSTANDHIGDVIDADATSSLFIREISPDQVEESLSSRFGTPTSVLSSEQPSRRLQVSAISISSGVSVSGPRADLSAFKAQAIPGITTTYAYVHGWYHGGHQLECVVDEVLKDFQRRAVTFPLCSTSTKPIRSTLDGSLFYASDTNASQLLAWLARHLLVYCVNWTDTAREIAANVRGLLNQEPASIVKLISFGPASGSLFPDFKPLDPRIELLDLSPFRASRKSRLSHDHQDSIAIVGVGVNLPQGKGTEEL
ncbi:hypothetical protein BJ170DRAFT_175553 [Xylariales sp. AK1849]|nr:hypothetical protein BJ170DRAFT_175553 [Xylariales sp. AK1849]